MKLLWMFVLALLVSGCNDCPDLDKDKIKEYLSKELHVGDSRKKVVQVLIKSGMDFSNDEYANAYHGIIWGGKSCPLDAILVDIYMDKSDAVLKIETSYSTTMP